MQIINVIKHNDTIQITKLSNTTFIQTCQTSTININIKVIFTVEKYFQ